MTRRQLIMLAASAFSLATHGALAQAPSVPLVGFLNTASPGLMSPLLSAFRKGLGSTGYVEGRNVAIEYRWAEGRYDRLQALSAELVRRNPAVIAATGGTVAGRAAKAATSTIPILFIAGFDPVREGLVTSIARPGGNATGVAVYTTELGAKRLAMLQQLVPGRPIAMLVNPEAASTGVEVEDAERAANDLKIELLVLKARTEEELQTAFSEASRRGAGAITVVADSFFTSQHAKIISLAEQHKLPACYPWPHYVDAGGLISYGPSLIWAYDQIGIYAGRILKGDKPIDLPVQLPKTFNTAINLKTAKALSLTIPPLLLVGADKVIE